MRTTCSETPASAPRDKLAPGATTVMPARVLALGQEKHLRVEQVPRGRAVRLCPGRGGFSILTLATCSSLLKVKLGSSSQGPKRKTVWQNWHESLPGRVISRCLYPCTTVGTHTGVQLRNEPQEPPGQGARGRRREPGTPHPRGPSEALSRQPTHPLSSAARGAVRGLPLRGDGREHRPPPCSAARCTSCRPSAPEASPSAAPTARAGRRTASPREDGRATPLIPAFPAPARHGSARLRLCGCTRAMAAYSKYLTVRHSAIVGGTAAACALLCLLNKRRAAAQHGWAGRGAARRAGGERRWCAGPGGTEWGPEAGPGALPAVGLAVSDPRDRVLGRGRHPLPRLRCSNCIRFLSFPICELALRKVKCLGLSCL